MAIFSASPADHQRMSLCWPTQRQRPRVISISGRYRSSTCTWNRSIRSVACGNASLFAGRYVGFLGHLLRMAAISWIYCTGHDETAGDQSSLRRWSTGDSRTLLFGRTRLLSSQFVPMFTAIRPPTGLGHLSPGDMRLRQTARIVPLAKPAYLPPPTPERDYPNRNPSD